MGSRQAAQTILSSMKRCAGFDKHVTCRLPGFFSVPGQRQVRDGARSGRNCGHSACLSVCARAAQASAVLCERSVLLRLATFACTSPGLPGLSGLPEHRRALQDHTSPGEGLPGQAVSLRCAGVHLSQVLGRVRCIRCQALRAPAEVPLPKVYAFPAQPLVVRHGCRVLWQREPGAQETARTARSALSVSLAGRDGAAALQETPGRQVLADRLPGKPGCTLLAKALRAA